MLIKVSTTSKSFENFFEMMQGNMNFYSLLDAPPVRGLLKDSLQH